MLRWLGVEEFAVRPHFGIAGVQAFDGDPTKTRRVTLVDTETLGLGDKDPTVEVTLRQLAYDPVEGQLLGVTDEYSGLQDPGKPVPEAITKLNGLTDADVKGKAFDRERIAQIVGGSALVISHNAAFDRPRIDALVPGPKCWACSVSMIDWKALGLPANALGALILAHGFYVAGAHRASADVMALHRLLATTNAETGLTYFAMLLEEARKPVDEVFAAGSPIAVKDRLKDRGYRWQSHAKVWTRVMPRGDSGAELDWLCRNAGCRKPYAKPIDPHQRFART